jgi:hypothetical protein
MGNGESGVAGWGTSGVMSTTVQSEPIQTKSSGKRMSFIQKAVVLPDSNMNSIPVLGGSLSRLDNPLVRLSGVSAISAAKATSPMVTRGVRVWGPGAGVLVRAGRGDAVGVAAGEGVDMGAGDAATPVTAVGCRAGVDVGDVADAGAGDGLAVGVATLPPV